MEGDRAMQVKKVRSDKKINVNPNLPQDVHDKLKKLAISCDMTKTKMAEKIITIMVNDPKFITHIQDIYNKESFYRITPIVEKGKVDF